MYDRNQAHYIVVTGILVKDGKFLITKRASWEKAFPEMWTVPGGKMEVLDYVLRERDTKHHWYNIFEDILKREIKEEVGLEVENIKYLTNMIYIRPDNIPCMIVSLYGDPIGEQVRLCNALTEYKWVTLEEAKSYDLIEGIYEEFEMLDKLLKGKTAEWKKK